MRSVIAPPTTSVIGYVCGERDPEILAYILCVFRRRETTHAHWR